MTHRMHSHSPSLRFIQSGSRGQSAVVVSLTFNLSFNLLQQVVRVCLCVCGGISGILEFCFWFKLFDFAFVFCQTGPNWMSASFQMPAPSFRGGVALIAVPLPVLLQNLSPSSAPAQSTSNSGVNLCARCPSIMCVCADCVCVCVWGVRQLLLRGPPKGSAAFSFFSTLLWALAVKLFVVSAKGVATDGTERQTDWQTGRQTRQEATTANCETSWENERQNGGRPKVNLINC